MRTRRRRINATEENTAENKPELKRKVMFEEEVDYKMEIEQPHIDTKRVVVKN